MRIEKLVKTLNTSEKKYFRKFAFRVNKKKNHSLLLLFNALCSNPELSDADLLKACQKENHNELRFIKNALKERLLETLSTYGTNDNQRLIFQYYQEAQWLKERSAMEEAIKRVRKGIALAHECSLHLWVVEGLSLEKKLLRAHTLWAPDNNRETEKIDIAIDASIKRFKEAEHFLSIDHKLFSLAGKRGRDIITDEHEEEMDLIIKPLVKNGPPDKENYEAHCLYYLSMSRYYGAKRNIEKKLEAERALIDFIIESPKKSKHFRSTFPTVLNNYLNSCIDMELYEDFEKYISYFDYKSKALGMRLRARVFLMAANLCLNRYLKELKLEKAANSLIQFESEAKDFYHSLEAEYFHVFHINCAIVSFGNFRFKNCIRWCNKLIAKGIRNPNKDILRIAFVLLLCCHYSLNNQSNLESLVQKYLRDKKEEKIPETEGILISLFRKKTTEKTDAGDLKTLQVKMNEIKNTKEKEFIDLILLKRWINFIQD